MNLSNGNSTRRRILPLALFAVITVSVWLGLERLGNKVDWLTLEGPTLVEPGTTVNFRVQTGRILTNGFLCVDLHWASDRNSPQGFLAAGIAQAIHQTNRTFDFSVAFPARDQLRFVHAILYLTPDGNWSNHTFAATSALIPVTTNGERHAAKLERLPLYQLDEGRLPASTPKFSLLRWLTGATWLFAAAMLVRQMRRNPIQPAYPGVSKCGWVTLAIGLVLAGVWELGGLENTLGTWARSVARTEDVYYQRAGFQKAVSSMVVALVLVLFWVGRRHQRLRLLPLGFGLYLALALVNLLSLHAIDRFAAIAWHGLVLVDVLKFLCAAVAIFGLYAGGRQVNATGIAPNPTAD